MFVGSYIFHVVAVSACMSLLCVSACVSAMEVNIFVSTWVFDAGLDGVRSLMVLSSPVSELKSFDWYACV